MSYIPRPPWTREALRGLGVVTDVQTAAQILRIGRGTAYRLARLGRFPVPLLVIGRRYVVPVGGLIRVLEAE